MNFEPANSLREIYLPYFGLVEDPTNWKLPTNGLATENELEAHMIKRAVEFFTGGSPEITATRISLPEWKFEKTIYKVGPTQGYYFHIGS